MLELFRGGALAAATYPEVTPHPFDSRPNLEALTSEQGVEPVEDFDALLGDFWPDDESADEFVLTLREWRRDALGA